MIEKLIGKTVAILGLGKSGMSTLESLKKRAVHIVAWDDKPELRALASGNGAVVKDLGNFDFSGVALFVISPSISHKNPAFMAAERAGVPIVSDVELFVNENKESHFIGITGTNGKSTTTALVHHILKENGIKCEIGGNFGIPVMSLPSLGKDGWYVLELSSYQLELTPSLALDAAILLNITPDHIDHHGSMSKYIEAKKLVFNNAKTSIVAVDDKHTRKIYDELDGKKVAVSYAHATDGIYADKNGILLDSLGKVLIDTNELASLKGLHNRQNIAAAWAACRVAGLADSKIAAAVKTYKSLDHRMQSIGLIDGIEFVNDSKATNAESAQWALDSFEDIYWIIGGRQKEGGVSSLVPKFARGNIKKAFAIGECEKEFYKTTKPHIDSYKCGTLDKAVEKAFKLARKDLEKGKAKNPVILLSPATASFDQYKCFEDRGLHFGKIFEKLRADNE